MRSTSRVIRSPFLPVVLILGMALPLMAASEAARIDPTSQPEGLPRLSEAATSTAISLQATNPTPIREIYRAIGEQAGVSVTFDRHLNDQSLAIEIRGLRLHAALDRVSKTVGHFWRAIDSSGIVVVDDTPQNRRNYELQVVRTFKLDHVRLADMMTVLRSVISLKNVAVELEGRTLTLRDTAAKVALASRLIERLDQPRQQITLDLALLRLPRTAVADLRAQARDNMLQISADHDRRLRSQGIMLAEPTLSIMGGESAGHKLIERVASTDGETLYYDVTLDFEARTQSDNDRVRLGVRTTAKLADTDGPISTRESSSAMAIGSDEAIALFDWMPVNGDEIGVLIIRPVVADRSQAAAVRQAGIVVGTEANIQMPERR